MNSGPVAVGLLALRLHHVLTLAAGITSFLLLGTAYAQNGGGSLSLFEAVERFQAAWGVDVSYGSSTLDDRFTNWSQPVADTAERDLQVLLTGTEVTYTVDSSGLFLLTDAGPQLRGTIVGLITDSRSGAPLRDVHIYNKENVNHGTTTTRDGTFSLSDFLPGPITLVARHMGLKTEEITVTVVAGAAVRADFELSEFVVEGWSLEVISTPLDHAELPRMFVPRSDFLDTRSTYDLGQIGGIGTRDPMHNLDDVSGVNLDRNMSTIHIQGSGFGEHQLRLDDITVFAPFHHGLVGAFSPLAIRDVRILKAGFEAAQGSFLAGVIQAKHALDVNESQSPLDVQIDPLSFNGRFNRLLRVGTARVELMAALRSSIWNNWWGRTRSESVDQLLLSWNAPDVFLMRASLYRLKNFRPDAYSAIVGQLAYVPPPALPDLGFDDIHVASRIALAPGHELSFSWYRGSNYLRGRYPIAVEALANSRIAPNDQHDWSNENRRIAWSHALTSRTKLIAAWRKGLYRFAHTYGGLDRQNSVTAAYNIVRYNVISTHDSNGITDYSVSASLVHEYPFGDLNAGLEQERSRHHFAIERVFPRPLEHARHSVRTAAFAQQTFRPQRWVELTAGSRFTWLHAQSKLYSEPRIAVHLRTPASGGYGAALSLASGVYYQFLNQFEIGTISPSTAVPSVRFWLPIDETLPAPMSVHYSADFSAQLWTDWTFRFEYYYKDQRRLYRIDYPKLWQLDDIPGYISSVSQFVSLTHGLAFGTSVELNHKREKLDFGIRHEYGKSRREFAFRGGELRTVPVPWNVPRQIQLQARLRPVRTLELSARWFGAWGRKWAYRQAYYDLLGTDVTQGLTFDEFDFRDPTAPGHELPPHKQLDLGLALNIKNDRRPSLQLRADVLNALGSANPAYLFLREQTIFEDPDESLTSETRYLLGRTLTLSAHLSW